jgi:AcrR family transcriptional regulator
MVNEPVTSTGGGTAPGGAVSTAADRAFGRAPAPNRRERARAAMLDEIKQTALELMREQGSPDVRFSDIARAMGLTAPALYRYYANRDELLTDMIVDAFNDLAAHLAGAVEAVGADDVGGRLFAAATAYRRWASAEPLQFALVFGQPVSGYHAPEQGPTTEAAQRAMSNLGALVTLAAERGELRAPLVIEAGPLVCVASEEKSAGMGHPIAANTYQAMLHAWAGLHGFTCLEAYGHLKWLGEQACDEIFSAQVRLAALAVGLPEPPATS